MSILDRALYTWAHDFPGGIEALATLLGKATGTVYNKADPGCETHQFTVKELVAASKFSGNTAALFGVCRVLDHAAVALGDYTRTSDLELLDVCLACERENGETAQAIGEALAQGAIGARDWATIDREIAEDIEAKLALRERLRGLRRG